MQVAPQDVICLVRSPEDANQLKELEVGIIQGSLEDKALLNKILTEHKIDLVFHCAAISNPSVDKELIFTTNIDGSNNILHAFIHSPHCHTFMFSSSISVYDSYLKSGGEPISENANIGSMTKGDPYAISKRIIEQEILHLQKLYPEKHFLIVRIGPICGAHDRLILPKLITLMSIKWLPKLIGKGRRKISIIAPEDAARAMIFLSQNSCDSTNSIYNAAGTMVSYREMFDSVASYYDIEYSKFSIPFWVFRAIRPFLWIIRIIFPKNKFVQAIFSKTALAFFSNSYEYDSGKLRDLGFEFLYSPQESIQKGLKILDPEKELIN